MLCSTREQTAIAVGLLYLLPMSGIGDLAVWTKHRLELCITRLTPICENHCKKLLPTLLPTEMLQAVVEVLSHLPGPQRFIVVAPAATKSDCRS